MRVLTTADELSDWVDKIRDQADFEAIKTMELMSYCFENDDWVLGVLHLVGADALLTATETPKGVLLKSRPEFHERFGIRIDWAISKKRFESISASGWSNFCRPNLAAS